MLNFNTDIGKPVYLDDSKEPAFYISANDIDFLEKADKLYKNVKEYSLKSKNKVIEVEKDEEGVVSNSIVFIEEMKKEFDFTLTQIDELLGEGVSKKVFKGRYSQELLAKFMEFLSQTIADERKNYMSKYIDKKGKKKGVL